MAGWFNLARWSLSFLWIFTGLTSVYFSPDIGYQVLLKAGITGVVADTLVYSGSALDVLIGLWLLLGRGLVFCIVFQGAVIVVYTVLLSIVDASFWLHPFGPLTKNLPILVLLLAMLNNIQAKSKFIKDVDIARVKDSAGVNDFDQR